MIPGSAYWDTSSLKELPFDLQDAIFLNLRDLCAEYGITMHTTRLCADELVELRREEFPKWVARFENPPQWIRERLGDAVEVKWVRPKGQLLDVIEESVLSTLASQGIGVVENAQIAQDRLLKMAVKKVLPFKDKGRGYRDAVTLLTIVEHERARAGRSGCIIIVADQDFQAAPTLPDAKGLDLTVVPSAEQAIGLIRGRMADFVKARFREEEERLKAFLDAHRDEIQDFVQRFAPSPPGVLMSAEGLGISEAVETIDADSIELLGIDSAFARPPADEREAWVDLGFTVRVRARATVEPSSVALLMWGVEESPQGYPRERIIETRGIISGSVLARESKGLPEYVGLRLQRFRWESPLSKMLRGAFSRRE